MEAIRGFVREAMTDLRGSIDREALPEMAMQLARALRAKLRSPRRAFVSDSFGGERRLDAGRGVAGLVHDDSPQHSAPGAEFGLSDVTGI